MADSSSAAPRLQLLGSFEFSTAAGVQTLSRASQRLLAYLALNPRLIDRTSVAGILWPWKSQDRAQANLRAALWRLPHGEVVVASRSHRIALDGRIQCDVQELERAARAVVLQGNAQAGLAEQSQGVPVQPDLLTCAAELLPDWDDDWLVVERECLRQLQLLALDALTTRLIDHGEARTAVLCALMAVKREPLRESSQRALVAAHIATGNYSEAHRQFTSYVALLRRELNAAPSDAFTKLVRDAINR